MNVLFHKWIGSFGVSYSIDTDGVYHWENWDNKPVPTQEEIKAKKIELDQEWEDLKYQRDRASAFPSIQDQLDMQYWDQVNGTTTWKDSIAKVKADNPKPE